MLKETPLVRLDKFGGLTVYAKLENKNPSGSIKYRTVLTMVEDAIKSGKLKKGMGIIERTSGNSGIALAKIGKDLGYPVTAVTGIGTTEDAKQRIKQFGAELIDVDGWFSACGKRIEELMEEKPESYYWPNQIANPSSLKSNTNLGAEIAEQFSRLFHDKLEVYAASMGTGSTITGVSTGLKKHNSELKTYLVLPESEYNNPGVDEEEEATVSLPLFDKSVVSGRIKIREEDAINAAKELHEKYGHYVGVSTGAVFAAMKLIAEKESGNAVMVFVDSGDRYEDILGKE